MFVTNRIKKKSKIFLQADLMFILASFIIVLEYSGLDIYHVKIVDEAKSLMLQDGSCVVLIDLSLSSI